MRQTILLEELHEAKKQEQVASKKIANIQKTSSLLEEERSKVESRLALLLEEKELVDKHIAEVNSKRASAKIMESEARQRTNLLEGTLENLEREIEKLEILQSGI